ncbi:cobyrinate a,c-diamide synthase [Clostridium sp. D2Q-14]|nr:cobyrinate a,c-diamide synthase [Anaeromonas gelatinilytica]MBS4535494.1 cobyrinate a,c-diamide synthase [Anaeromonas gelatinilytica]
MIAGTSSGTGKTTLSLGIMAALKRRKLDVRPFKVGPDYIDPGFHEFVTGNASYNLDSWMLKKDTIKYLFNKNMKDKDIGIIEGVMGLYDGFGTDRNTIGSSAHVSKLLKTPIILVMDGRAMSTSAAAMVMGYKVYDENVDIRGVIINKVSGDGHYNLLKEAIERDTGIKCLGYLPKDLNISLNSRHLGLIPVKEVEEFNNKVDLLVNYIEKYVDLDSIIGMSKDVELIEFQRNYNDSYREYGQGLKIGIMKDKAFNFYYQDNIDLLKEMGVEIEWISPLEDNRLPSNLDGLYIGGGFPEVFSKELQENTSFKTSLKEALESGLPTYGECGGLMYLTEGIEDLYGNNYEMVGFLPTRSVMTKRLQRFGYVEVESSNHINIRAHEFHHSKIIDNEDLDYEYKVIKRRPNRETKVWNCGIKKKNVLAGYPHVHFYSNIDFIKQLIDICRNYRGGEKI